MKWMNQKLWAVALAGMTVTILGSLAVQAKPSSQPSNSQTPKFTQSQDPAAFSLSGESAPFTPATLGKSENPFPFRAVIKGDDRVPMMSHQFPWSAVGRIEGVDADGGRYSCTGTLIAKNIVLTNSHCVINPETRKVSRSMRFLPNLVNGLVRDEEDIAYVEEYYYGTDFKDDSSIDDWAVLKLDRPLGTKYGFLGWKTFSPTELRQNPKKLSLVGYSADFPKNPKNFPGVKLTAGPGMTAGVHKGCSIVGEQAGLLLHDCDTYGGASGGPILTKIGDQYYVVALHAGWRRVNGKVLNYAVQMARIDKWIKRQKK